MLCLAAKLGRGACKPRLPNVSRSVACRTIQRSLSSGQHQPSQPPHEYGPGIRPKDATDKEARTPRSRGRSVVVLYNETRTHLSLAKDAPLSRAVKSAGRILCRPVLPGL